MIEIGNNLAYMRKLAVSTIWLLNEPELASLLNQSQKFLLSSKKSGHWLEFVLSIVTIINNIAFFAYMFLSNLFQP